MTYEAKVLCDSVAFGVRLTTLEVTMPRFVLAEFNTHRMLSRNSASSRAIPVEKRLAAVRDNPFVPEAFAKNKAGMQAGDVLDRLEAEHAKAVWLGAAEDACKAVERLLDVHKQWANRLLEPFCWHTVIVTATEWDNFFAQRCSPEAQPEMRRVAELMREAMQDSRPNKLGVGYVHLPLVDARDWFETRGDEDVLRRLSVARCARVSYLTHDGRRDLNADLSLHERLLQSGHMSPFEHVAHVAPHHTSHSGHPFCGNFRLPWVQYRKTLPNEDVWSPT